MSKSISGNLGFVNFICKYRELNCMTQSELAIKVGVSVNTISSWETGTSIPTAYNAAILCDVLGVPFSSLFFLFSR